VGLATIFRLEGGRPNLAAGAQGAVRLPAVRLAAPPSAPLLLGSSGNPVRNVKQKT
jgi:hypothetical protein